MQTTVPILIGLSALVLLTLGAVLDDRRARVRRREPQGVAALVPPLLHSINDDRCIGCEACVDVCPTEVLDLVDHKVAVARFSDCVQCEQCANACPTQALVMYRQGEAPRMLTVPELDDHFQTGVPGQYLIGEVAGKPLVKNAANLGRAVIEHIARELAGGRPVPGVLDVVIVGSGPGGLSAGLTCIRRTLSCLVLEKEHVLASTVARYPKGKHFMAEPCSAQNVSYLPVFDGTKEQLVAAWTQVVQGARLPIRLGEAVETVQRGDDGVFTIKTTVGSYRARAVVLATGLRGKPRLLAVPGANLEKVQSLLDDPAEFAGEHALVVGGGDSAVEGAIALAEAGATVTLSYRGDGFKRCKQGNQKRLAEMTAGQRLTVLLESNVRQFTPDAVTIARGDGTDVTIPNQRAFVLIGADTPVAWLEANNVRFVERPHLYALGSTEDVVRRFAPDAAACPNTADEALAIVLDRPAARPRHHMRSVAQHLRDEFHEVVTSVSAAFRLSDLEPPHDARRAMNHTPARGASAMRGSAKLIPASRLTTGRPATERGGTGARSAVFGLEPTVIGPAPTAPLRPRSPQRRARTNAGAPGNATLPLFALGRDGTTDAVPSLPAQGRAAGLSGTPSTPPTDEIAQLRRAPGSATDGIASLRAHEDPTRQVTALQFAGDDTEEVPSLRALEDPAAADPPFLADAAGGASRSGAPRRLRAREPSGAIQTPPRGRRHVSHVSHVSGAVQLPRQPVRTPDGTAGDDSVLTSALRLPVRSDRAAARSPSRPAPPPLGPAHLARGAGQPSSPERSSSETTAAPGAIGPRTRAARFVR